MNFRFPTIARRASQLASLGCAAEEYQQVFPKVKLQCPGFLEFISSYAKERNMKPLLPDHLRFFIQPLGIIDSLLDVDLKSGAFTRNRGTHDKEGIQKGKLSERNRVSLIALLQSKNFQEMPGQESKISGLDGCNYFVETDWSQH